MAKPKEIAMHVTATEAKNRFGYLCDQAKRAPVFVEKAGRVETVILSAQAFEALSASAREVALKQRPTAFDQVYAEWLNEANARFESRGVWCEDLRVW